jgi:hypothetical protein
MMAIPSLIALIPVVTQTGMRQILQAATQAMMMSSMQLRAATAYAKGVKPATMGISWMEMDAQAPAPFRNPARMAETMMEMLSSIAATMSAVSIRHAT